MGVVSVSGYISCMPALMRAQALIRGGRSHMALVNALIARFSFDEEGQGLAEYALILALIAIVAIVALIFLGGQISVILNKGATSVSPTQSSPAADEVGSRRSRFCGVDALHPREDHRLVGGWC